jgi:hypothetical protein
MPHRFYLFIFFFNQAPASPQSAFSLLGDYITLAKTRLKDLNEAPGFGLFGHEFVSVSESKGKVVPVRRLHAL